MAEDVCEMRNAWTEALMMHFINSSMNQSHSDSRESEIAQPVNAVSCVCAPRDLCMDPISNAFATHPSLHCSFPCTPLLPKHPPDAIVARYFESSLRGSSTSNALMRFFKNSNTLKKMALITHDLATETPSPAKRVG